MSFISSKKYALVPMELINNPNIEAKDKLQMIGVYIALQKFTNLENKCFPSQETIGEIFGKSRSWANVSLKKLEQFRFVEKQIKNKFGTYEYTLQKHKDLSNEKNLSNGVTSITTPVNRVTQSNKTNKNINTSKLEIENWKISAQCWETAMSRTSETFAKKTLERFKSKVAKKYQYNFDTQEEIESIFLSWLEDDYNNTNAKTKLSSTNNVKMESIKIDTNLPLEEKSVRKNLLEIVGNHIYKVWFENTVLDRKNKVFVGKTKFQSSYLMTKFSDEIKWAFEKGEVKCF